MIYLDNAATTKPCEQAIKAAADTARNCFGNVSSLHKLGIESEKLMNSASKTLLNKLSCKGTVYFTSGATESNNLAVRGVADAYKRRGNRIVTTAMEHPSVARVMDALEKQGFEIVRLSPKDAIDNFEQYIADNVTKDTILVSCMAVNNENGFRVDTEKLYRLVKSANNDTVVHIDGVQGFCKVKLMGDLISISAHKIHGLKGIGALYCADKIRFSPLVYGGGQQKNLRPGTEPVELIASFEAAVKAYPTDLSHYGALNRRLRERLGRMEDVYINSPDNSVDNILSFSVLGVRSEIMLHSLEEHDIFVSSGSACSKGKISSVPDSFGLSADRADSTIRVSFSMETTEDDIDRLADEIENGIARFRRTKSKSRAKKGNDI